MEKHYIYCIKHISKNRYYVGETSNYIKRISYHMKCGQKGYLSCDRLFACRGLYLAMHKYGIVDFVFGVVEECNYSDRFSREYYWIKKLKSNTKNGYNTLPGINPAQFKALSKSSNIDKNTVRHILCKKNNIEYSSIIRIDDDLIEHSRFIKTLIDLDNPIIKKNTPTPTAISNKTFIRKDTPLKCGTGVTNIYLLKNKITNQLHIGTNQLKCSNAILDKLFDNLEKKSIGELYEHLKLFNKNDFELIILENEISIDHITEELKLHLFTKNCKLNSFKYILTDKQKDSFINILVN